MVSGSSIGRDLVAHAVGIDARGERRRAVEQRGEARAEGQAPDRVDVDAHRPQQREPVGLRLRQRALVGEDVVVARLGQRQRADDAAGVAADAVRVGELHAVGVEARRRVARRARPSASPAREGLARPGRSGRPRTLRPAAGSGGPSCARRRPRARRAGRRRSRRRVERRAPRARRTGPSACRCTGHRQRARSRPRWRSGFRGYSGMRLGCTTGKPRTVMRVGERQGGEPMTSSGHYDAYTAFSEGMRLLADDNAHAAVIALEQARELEPAKGSVREALARAYFRTGPLRRGRAGVHRDPRHRAGQRLRPVRRRACAG